MKLTPVKPDAQRAPYLPEAGSLIIYRAQTLERIPWPRDRLPVFPYLDWLMRHWLSTTLPRWSRTP